MGDISATGFHVQDRAASSARGPFETRLEVEGAMCGACVARIEAALRAVPGVTDARFELTSRLARIEHPAAIAFDTLRAAVDRAGYRAGAPSSAKEVDRERRATLWRMGVAGLAMMQVMMLAYPAYVADAGTLDWDVQRMLAYSSLLLTLPVIFFCAAPIWTAAWRGLRAGHPGMDVPVALGILAAFLASLPATFHGGPVYYDAITMFVFFLATGRHFEAKALAATVDATDALTQLLPRRAIRIEAGQHRSVDPGILAPGDRVWIAAGEAAPADCLLLEGAGDFNEALLTGESAPAAKRPGDALLAGSVNLGAPVEAQVERTGEQLTLAAVRRMVENAGREKPRWTLLAERIAMHFVTAVILLAAAASAYWLSVDPAQALPVAIAVLVVSCPCALALATPVALTACANALAKGGVLVTRGRSLEALAGVTRVAFDKTGTLTTGRMSLTGVHLAGGETRAGCLAIAASLEQAMPHPLAHAIVAAASGVRPGATDIVAVPGEGVEARFEGRRHRIGSAPWCAALAGSPAPFAIDADSPLTCLAREGEWLARFAFDDTLRPEAPEVLRRLRELGVRVSLLSGDRDPVVRRVAQALGIDEVESAAQPGDKARYLADRAAAGEVVAMVGDGVNDAPGLARADVAIAMGQGAALARSQADLVVINPSLLAIPDAIATARRARRVIAQNLGWAAAYNAVMLPLALSGMLAPWMASLGMSISSLAVVANALRIARRAG